MSESQQGPEICDVTIAKCYLKAVNLPILSPGIIYVVRSFRRASKLDKKSVWKQAT